MDTTSRIFVQIAAYRDPECQYTVRDLFEKAANPERVAVGICWQFVESEDAHCFQVETRPEQVRMAKFNALESKGVCWARNETQKLWRGEEYTLVIDSHSRFEKGWDTLLIAELAKCDSAKPFLSCDPPPYVPPNTLGQAHVTVKRANPFRPNGVIRFEGERLAIPPSRPLRGAFIVACFMFSSARVIEEVPYDPYMYFGQEESTYSIRLFTHGWDVFSPTRVFLYHYYNIKRNDKLVDSRRLHHEDNREWGRMFSIGQARAEHMTGYRQSTDAQVLAELDKYGLGTARTLEEYQEFCGINFKTREISDKAYYCGWLPDIQTYRPKMWKKPNA